MFAARAIQTVQHTRVFVVNTMIIPGTRWRVSHSLLTQKMIHHYWDNGNKTDEDLMFRMQHKRDAIKNEKETRNPMWTCAIRRNILRKIFQISASGATFDVNSQTIVNESSSRFQHNLNKIEICSIHHESNAVDDMFVWAMKIVQLHGISSFQLKFVRWNVVWWNFLSIKFVPRERWISIMSFVFSSMKQLLFW